MRRFKPDGLRVGEIVYAWVEGADKPKYQLCVRSLQTRGDFGFVMLDTGHKGIDRPNCLTVNSQRILLPRPKTGLTKFKFGKIRPLGADELGPDATVFPTIGRILAKKLALFVEKEVNILQNTPKRELLDALRSITAEDPTPAMRRAFRASLYASKPIARPTQGATLEPAALREISGAVEIHR